MIEPCAPNCGSNTSLMFNPICCPIISPAHCAAMNEKLRTMPMASPKIISPPMPMASCHIVSGISTGRATAGTRPSARMMTSSPLMRRGIRALPNSGANSIIPATRNSTRAKVGTVWSRSSIDMGTLRRTLAGRARLLRQSGTKHVPRVFEQPLRDPRHEHDGGDRHRGDFRDERERLFLDLRDRLEQRHEDADGQADQEHRRGNRESEDKRMTNEIGGLINVH